jgi:microcompartment protein CcmL/EutN
VAAVQTAVVVAVQAVTEMGHLLWWLVLTRLRLVLVVLQPQAMLELA